jgi:2-dehydropantoate 2-reductase
MDAANTGLAPDSPAVRRVPVPVVEHPAGGYDLIAVFVCTHQVDAVLESLAGLEGDVLFLLNWAAGPEPLGAVTGPERVLLGFPLPARWTATWSATARRTS